MGVEREVQAEVRAVADGVNKDRAVAVADIDGDGYTDLIAADAKGNAIASPWRNSAPGKPGRVRA